MTPEQLEEFESAFRAFDKDVSNSLDIDELSGALGSLGFEESVSRTFLPLAELPPPLPRTRSFSAANLTNYTDCSLRW